MRRQIYVASVVLTAVALFWPVIYGNVRALHALPGSPILQAVVGVLVFGALAYFTYEEEGGVAKEEKVTASG